MNTKYSYSFSVIIKGYDWPQQSSWLRETLGKYGELWYARFDALSIHYWFKNESDMMLFAIRWA